MEGALGLIKPISNGLKALLSSIEDDSCEFGKGELDFMETVKMASPTVLPFKYIFTQIENTHKQGLSE